MLLDTWKRYSLCIQHSFKKNTSYDLIMKKKKPNLKMDNALKKYLTKAHE